MLQRMFYFGLGEIIPIPTLNLGLYWDAGIPDSYPGSGTTVYDITGNARNGTLNNGVGFAANNSGVLTFDGTNDYVRVLDQIAAGSNSITIGVWVKHLRTSGQNDVFFIGNSNITSRLAFNSGTPVFICRNSTGTELQLSLGSVTTNTWYLYVYTYNGTTFTGYKNGSQQNTSNISGVLNTETGQGVYLANYGGNYGQHEIGSLWIYNRVLAAAEVSDIFNTTKQRFGY